MLDSASSTVGVVVTFSSSSPAVKSITTVVVSGAIVDVSVTKRGEGRLKNVVSISDSVVTASVSTTSVTVGVSVVRSITGTVCSANNVIV